MTFFLNAIVFVSIFEHFVEKRIGEESIGSKIKN